MTVKELYEVLKKEIDNGHGNVPVMIHDYVKDNGYCICTEITEVEDTCYYKKSDYWPEHIEIGR